MTLFSYWLDVSSRVPLAFLDVNPISYISLTNHGLFFLSIYFSSFCRAFSLFKSFYFQFYFLTLSKLPFSSHMFLLSCLFFNQIVDATALEQPKSFATVRIGFPSGKRFIIIFIVLFHNCILEPSFISISRVKQSINVFKYTLWIVLFHSSFVGAIFHFN